MRSSIKSLTSIVRNQGLAIKELKNIINSKVDKSELDLTSKCDKNEMNQIILDLKKMINTKASNDQVNQLLNDKITKNEARH